MKKFLLFLLVTLFAACCLAGCGAPAGSSDAQSPDESTSQMGTLPPAGNTGDTDPAPDEAPSNDETPGSVVGAWVGEDDAGNKLPYIFYEDGTGYAAIFPMTYTVEDDIITLVIQGFDSEEVIVAQYTVTEDTLILDTGEETAILQRTELPE